MSFYSTGLRRNKEMGKNFNCKTLEWKRDIEAEYNGMKAVGLDPSKKEVLKAYQEVHEKT